MLAGDAKQIINYRRPYQQQQISTNQHFRKSQEGGCKTCWLSTEEHSTERALEVHWNAEKDRLCLKLDLRAGNMTIRGMFSTLRVTWLLIDNF